MKLLKSKTNDFLDLLWKMFHLSSLLIAGSLVIVLLRYFLADNSLFIWHNAEFKTVMAQLPAIFFMKGFKYFSYAVIAIWFYVLSYPAFVDLFRDCSWKPLRRIFTSYNDYFAFYPSGKVKVPYNVDTYGTFIGKYLTKTRDFLWLVACLYLFFNVLYGNQVQYSWLGRIIFVLGIIVIIKQLIFQVDMGKGYLEFARFEDWKSCFKVLHKYKGKYESKVGFLYMFASENSGSFYIVFFETDAEVEPKKLVSAEPLYRFNNYGDARAYIDELIDKHTMVIDQPQQDSKQ